MKKLIIAVFAAVLTACGAQAKAVEHAEYKCLQADLAALKVKLQAGVSNAGATAAELTAGELVCAFEALYAKPAPAAGAGSGA